ncbi:MULTISPECIES: YbeD family protein [Silvimonas]|uniref:YbeD family protein n=1 Tax=Silvimonas TaxID=300264 RepID=UPI0024B3A3D2|nr:MULTISPECIES: DUF493 domain-containing protein [Silvimonas]MDR3425970.1 DUF493 domain-containing protein [Silvimonas sp.]
MSEVNLTDLGQPKLEDLVEFPVLIPVKAVSRKQVAQDEFHAALMEVTVQHIPGFLAELVTIRESREGNYYAATLSITFESVEQVHAIDAALRAHPLVRMVL